MSKFKKLFGEINFSWKVLIIYSVVTGVAVGLLNCVPFLKNTSFVYPAVTFEYWFVAALFVITNCKSTKDAMIKTFLFFLISQPLIYLVEVPFKALGWGLFAYYRNWIVPTILTIPGSAIAYQVKRKNVLSAVILSVAVGYLFFTGFGSVKTVIKHFPYGLVAAIFCFGFGVFFIHALLDGKKNKIVAYICSIVIAGALLAVTLVVTGEKTASTFLDSEHTWEIVETDAPFVIEGSMLTVTTKKDGKFHVTVKNELGETQTYIAIFEDGTMEFKLEE